jgi:hypothetical protein
MLMVCPNDQSQQHQWLDEETILDAKRAVLSVLVEECADHADTGVLRQVQERVRPIRRLSSREYSPGYRHCQQSVGALVARGPYGNEFQRAACGCPKGTNTNTNTINYK